VVRKAILESSFFKIFEKKGLTGLDKKKLLVTILGLRKN
jgi:hypothetical protein